MRKNLKKVEREEVISYGAYVLIIEGDERENCLVLNGRYVGKILDGEVEYDIEVMYKGEDYAIYEIDDMD